MDQVTLSAFASELEKISATRAVLEHRNAVAAGDTAGASQIAKGYGDLGLKPRYLNDISPGGAEAGVDLMMGHRAGPSGEANADGYLARKLYKPDSTVTQGRFTPKLLDQKQRITDTARALGPEAREAVPAMYGHESMGRGPLRRTVSYHEFSPPDPVQPPLRGEIGSIQESVAKPLAAKGMRMTDALGPADSWSHNPNNVVTSGGKARVLDFLPKIKGEPNVVRQSVRQYAPDLWRHEDAFGVGESGLDRLRKEVFNPSMKIKGNPASKLVGQMPKGLLAQIKKMKF